jgi:hypothetical protein
MFKPTSRSIIQEANRPTKRKRGRQPVVEVREEMRKIASLLSAGFSPQEIKAELSLSNRQYRYRMDLIRSRSHDAPHVWSKYQAKVETRYRQLEQIRQMALRDEKLDVARRAIENMVRLDKEIIDVGQALGAYEKQAQKHEHSIVAPTLGMFHDQQAIEADYQEVAPRGKLPPARANNG